MSRWFAWAQWTGTILCLALVVPIAIVTPEAFSGAANIAVGVAVICFIVAFATVGLVVALRRRENAIGWILGFAGFVYAVVTVATAYSEYAYRVHNGSLPGALAATWLSAWVWNFALGPGAVLPLLLFPDGRLPSRRWRPVLWMAVVGVVLMSVGSAFAPGRIDDFGNANPVGIDGAKGFLDFLVVAGTIAVVLSFLAAVVAVVGRFRRATGDEREQLKWLTYSAGVIVVAGFVSAVLVEPVSVDTSNAIQSFALTTYPVALGIAILRHRLYEIDVVINRTLVYAGLTATLAGAYLGLVLLLQLALDPVTSGSSLAVAVSTLAVAALFRPARARIQAGVDKRFYRHKYDAAQTLESFSARLREQVDLEALGAELREVVRDTMQPAHVSLWLRRPGART